MYWKNVTTMFSFQLMIQNYTNLHVKYVVSKQYLIEADLG